jgi:hypothetical protein
MRAILCTILATALLCIAPACDSARADPPAPETTTRGKAGWSTPPIAPVAIPPIQQKRSSAASGSTPPLAASFRRI